MDGATCCPPPCRPDGCSLQTIAVDLPWLLPLRTAAGNTRPGGGNNSKSKLAVRQENLNKSLIGLTMYGPSIFSLFSRFTRIGLPPCLPDSPSPPACLLSSQNHPHLTPRSSIPTSLLLRHVRTLCPSPQAPGLLAVHPDTSPNLTPPPPSPPHLARSLLLRLWQACVGRAQRHHRRADDVPYAKSKVPAAAQPTQRPPKAAEDRELQYRGILDLVLTATTSRRVLS